MKFLSLALLVLSPVIALAAKVSRDGKCGDNKGFTCLGSSYGDCCSQYGWCGSTQAYCASGCQSAFGICSGSKLSSSIHRPSSSTSKISSSFGARTLATTTRPSPAMPTATQSVSTDARCGPSFGGRTCQSSRWGNCCSQYSYCGSTIDYCNAKTCQKGFGQCNAEVWSSKRITTTSSKSLTTSSKAFTISSQPSPTTSIIQSSTSSVVSSSATSSSSPSDSSIPSSSIVTSTSSSVAASSIDSPSSTTPTPTPSSSFSSTLPASSATPAPSDTPTPTSTISSSSTVPANPLPTCGVIGDPELVSSYGETINVSLETCRDYCLNRFFGYPCSVYGQKLGTLTCYNSVSVTETANTFEGAVNRNSDGKYIFFDISCPEPTVL